MIWAKFNIIFNIRMCSSLLFAVTVLAFLKCSTGSAMAMAITSRTSQRTMLCSLVGLVGCPMIRDGNWQMVRSYKKVVVATMRMLKTRMLDMPRLKNRAKLGVVWRIAVPYITVSNASWV